MDGQKYGWIERQVYKRQKDKSIERQKEIKKKNINVEAKKDRIIESQKDERWKE